MTSLIVQVVDVGRGGAQIRCTHGPGPDAGDYAVARFESRSFVACFQRSMQDEADFIVFIHEV